MKNFFKQLFNKTDVISSDKPTDKTDVISSDKPTDKYHDYDNSFKNAVKLFTNSNKPSFEVNIDLIYNMIRTRYPEVDNVNITEVYSIRVDNKSDYINVNVVVKDTDNLHMDLKYKLPHEEYVKRLRKSKLELIRNLK
jgi:hypothetical protein